MIYCFKVGWKFGLFFDLDRQDKLDADATWLALGKLYRELSFQYIYEVLKTGTQFEEMTKDGWFPFIELLGWQYKALSEAYRDRFDFENRIEAVVGSFSRVTIERITGKWWNNRIFQDKRKLLQAGINAYLRIDHEGYINCIKTLLTEAEGIIRLQYFNDIGKSNEVKMLLTHLLERGKTKTGSDDSLLLPLPFRDYLLNVVFSNFDLATGQINLSRNSSSHGLPQLMPTQEQGLYKLFYSLTRFTFISVNPPLIPYNFLISFKPI